MSNKGLQHRIIELEDTIQQLLEAQERIEAYAEECLRREEVMRERLKKAKNVMY